MVGEPCGTLRVGDPTFVPLGSFCLLERFLIKVDGKALCARFLSEEAFVEEAKRDRWSRVCVGSPLTWSCTMESLVRRSGETGAASLAWVLLGATASSMRCCHGYCTLVQDWPSLINVQGAELLGQRVQPFESVVAHGDRGGTERGALRPSLA